MPILPLSPLVLARICAGEVISNPASVLKELLDNAVDSGATKIQASFTKHGLELIEVSDNGTGIPYSDLPQLGKKHHTSKITTDITNIETLGFRGEALASLSIAGSLSILTKSPSDSNAWLVNIAEGVPNKITPAARHEGTTVLLQGLFRTMPVKLRFLDSTIAEHQRLILTFWRCALAHPHLSFQLSVDGKIQYTLTPESIESRLQRLRKLNYKRFDFTHDSVKISLFYTEVSHKSSLTSFTSVNNRPLYSLPSLDKTVTDCLKTYLSAHHKTVYCAVLTLPYDQVDLHIHPSKKEVRLSHSTDLLTAFRTSFISHLEKTESKSLRSFKLNHLKDITLSEVLGWHYLHTVDNTALFLETNNLVTLDLKAAFRRVYHDPFITGLQRPSKLETLELDSYLTLTADRAVFYKLHEKTFETQGLVYDWWSPTTLRLRQLPGITPDPGNPQQKEFLLHLIEYLYTHSISDLSTLDIKDLFRTAPQPNTPSYTTKAEVQGLVMSLFSTSCPQKGVTGEPTFKSTPLSQLKP
jgi:DNA mismatch repair protein MutL